MEFTYKSLEEVSKMTIEEQSAYMVAKTAHEAGLRKKEIDSAIEEANKNNVSKEDLQKLIDKQSEVIKEIERIGLEQKKAQEGGAKKVESTILEQFKSNKETIQKVAKGQEKEFVIKATTNRASITNDSQSLRIPDIGQLGVKERSLYNIFPKYPVAKGNHKGTVVYIDWDEATTVRAAAMVAEGAAFPESTAKFQEYTLPLKKVGDTLPVTEEFFEDEVAAAAELEMFLNTNVETVIDNQIAVGDGTGQNLTGLVASVPAYTAVASGIPSANIYDLVTKVRTDIVKGRGSKYAPNFVAMTSVTADRLKLEKDANDNYIFRNDTSIGSMVIIEDNNMADNTLVVGDSRFGRIYEMGGVVLTKGEINAQFTSDMTTLKARKRLLFLIRTVDKTGFRKVTDVTAALTTLAS